MTISDSTTGYPSEVALRSERLVLRTFRREDLNVEDLWPNFDEPIYRHYTPPRDSPESKDRRFHEGQQVFDLKLAILDSDLNVGYVGLYQSDYTTREAWMGIQFAADQRGKGYCKESLYLLCDAFLNQWGMEKMLLEVAIFNVAGVKCYEAVGFRKTKQFWHPKAYQRRLDFDNDPRLGPIRQHFRRIDGRVEVEYLEMAMTRETFPDRLR